MDAVGAKVETQDSTGEGFDEAPKGEVPKIKPRKQSI
jgi:hypothetical protein